MAATSTALAPGSSGAEVPRRRTVVVDGRRVSYLTAGSGPPVVLVHGSGLDSATLSWRETVPSLAVDHAVVAPDLPGYGESAPLVGPPSVAAFSHWLEGFLDEFDEGPVTLVGISLGGAVALGLALDHPERVDRLVLVDSYGLGDRVPGGPLAALSVRIPGLMAGVWALMARSRWLTETSLRAIVHSANVTPALVEEVFGLVGGRSSATWRAFQREEVGFGGLRTDYSARLPALAVRTLFVHGENDPLVLLGWSVRAATRVPDGGVAVIRRCGHWPPRERPTTFNERLRDFLAGDGRVPAPAQSNSPVER